MSPPQVYCQERRLVFGWREDPYWNVRSLVLGQGPRWRWQQGVNCQSFLRVNILWQHHPGSTVNPVLGVNILSFTDEGESIYVQDMFCLLIGCGNAWRQNTSDTSTSILRFAIYFEDRRGVEERDWNGLGRVNYWEFPKEWRH